MKYCAVVFLILAYFHPCVVAQDQYETALKLNHLTTRLSVIGTMSRMPSSDFEFTNDQKKMIAELGDRHQEMMKLAIEIEDPLKRLSFILPKMKSFDEELVNEILVEHQENQLEALVFNKYVRGTDGNFAQAVLMGHSSFGLSKSQLESVKKLSEESKKEVAKAREKFKKEIEEISARVKEKLGSILNGEQMKKVQRTSQAKGQTKPIKRSGKSEKTGRK